MKLRSYDHDLYSFDGKPLRPRGIIKLPLELKDDPDRKGLYTSHDIEFLVVNIDSPYNAIVRQNSIDTSEMAVSMAHFKAKFPTPNCIGVCKGD